MSRVIQGDANSWWCNCTNYAIHNIQYTTYYKCHTTYKRTTFNMQHTATNTRYDITTQWRLEVTPYGVPSVLINSKPWFSKRGAPSPEAFLIWSQNAPVAESCQGLGLFFQVELLKAGHRVSAAKGQNATSGVSNDSDQTDVLRDSSDKTSRAETYSVPAQLAAKQPQLCRAACVRSHLKNKWFHDVTPSLVEALSVPAPQRACYASGLGRQQNACKLGSTLRYCGRKYIRAVCTCLIHVYR